MDLSRWLAIMACMFAWTACAQTNTVGTAAPTPVLATFDGQYQFLGKLYYAGESRAKDPKSVVVLSFMALECAPCRKELPVFLEVMRKAALTPGTPVRYFLVNLDKLSRKEELRVYLEGAGVKTETEVLLDPYHKASNSFGVIATPRTFVISPAGRIVADISGAVDEYRVALTQGLEKAMGK